MPAAQETIWPHSLSALCLHWALLSTQRGRRSRGVSGRPQPPVLTFWRGFHDLWSSCQAVLWDGAPGITCCRPPHLLHAGWRIIPLTCLPALLPPKTQKTCFEETVSYVIGMICKGQLYLNRAELLTGVFIQLKKPLGWIQLKHIGSRKKAHMPPDQLRDKGNICSIRNFSMDSLSCSDTRTQSGRMHCVVLTVLVYSFGNGLAKASSSYNFYLGISPWEMPCPWAGTTAPPTCQPCSTTVPAASCWAPRGLGFPTQGEKSARFQVCHHSGK